MAVAALAFVFVLSIVGLLVLGFFIARETRETTVTDRQSAISQAIQQRGRSPAAPRPSERDADDETRDGPA